MPTNGFANSTTLANGAAGKSSAKLQASQDLLYNIAL
jgi:hypothetical protein